MFRSPKVAPIPQPVIDNVIQPVDPRYGPLVTKKHWQNNREILSAPITQQQLANVKDVADFLNARKEFLMKPTPAVWIDNLTTKAQAVNPLHLSTENQAVDVADFLWSIGYKEYIWELQAYNPFSRMVWNGETRRLYMVGDLPVSLVLHLLATTTVENAIRTLKAEHNLA